MDAATTQLAADLITGLGLPGLVILVLAGALKHVFGLYVASIEQRVQEGAENRTAIERNTSAMTALTEVIKDRRT